MNTHLKSLYELMRFIGLLLVFLSLPLHAKDVLDGPQSRQAAFEAPMSYWIEEAEGITIGDAFQHFREGAFTEPASRPIVGHSNKAVWFAIELQQGLDSATEWVLELKPATVDKIDFYLIDTPEIRDLEPLRSGRILPLNEKALETLVPAFNFSITNPSSIILLRVSSVSLLNLQARIYAASLYMKIQQLEFISMSLKYGVLISFIIIGLAGAAALRQLDLMLTALYCIINLIFWLSQDGIIAFLIPAHFVRSLNMIHYGLLCLSFIFSNLVFSRCLELRRYSALWGFSVVLVSIFCGFLFLVDFVVGQQKFLPVILNTMFIALTIFTLTSLANLLLDRKGSATIFSLTYIFYSAAISLGLLHHLGYLDLAYLSFDDPSYSQLIIISGLLVSIFARSFELHDANIRSMAQIESLTVNLKNLQSSAEEYKHFHDMMDHEIKIPITVILSSIQSLRLIDERYGQSPQRDARYDKIERNAKRAERLFNIINLSPRHNFKKIEGERYDLLKEVFSIANEFPQKSRIFITYTDEPQPFFVEIDRSLFHFITFNILDNAIKYSKEGTDIKVNIESCYRDGKNYICISVINDSKKPIYFDLSRMFDRYTRFDETSNHAGLGLGLFLVKKIVEAHNGRIVATVESGKELTITMSLLQLSAD